MSMAGDVEYEDHDASESGSSEFEQLFKQSLTKFKKGELVKGRILSIQPTAVLIDLGHKSDGIVSIEQFSPEERATLKPGDELEVMLEESEDRGGNLVLSREKARNLQAWDDLNTAYQRGTVIKGRVVSKIKGGLTVDIGVPAFLPGSQLDVRPVRDLDQYLGRTIEVKIIKMNSGRGNIVLSRRVIIEEEQRTRRDTALAAVVEGSVVRGTVKNITDFGMFVDIGGIDGLVHVTDLSWGRAAQPRSLYKTGESIEVKVLKFDREKQKISLGIKQLTPDPWLAVVDKYPVGSRVRGTVTNLADFGAFIELEDGVEGMAHVSEMSWIHKVKHPSSIMKVGDRIDAQVIAVDQSARRISLGIRQTTENPWNTVDRRYPVGSTVEGKVRTITDFGAFVRIEDGIDGLVHVSDLSWTKHVNHPGDVLKKGQTVKAVVLNIDPAKKRISLGVKQLEQDPWKQAIPERYRVGQDEPVRVVKKAENGLTVEMEFGIEGFIPSSELLPDAPEVAEGETVTARVIRVDRGDHRIALSIKAHVRGRDKESLKEFMNQQQKFDTSIGALLRDRGN